MEAGQVKAEFDSFKSMTRTVMKQKDEELKRLLQLEEGLRSRAQEVGNTVRHSGCLSSENLRWPGIST